VALLVCQLVSGVGLDSKEVLIRRSDCSLGPLLEELDGAQLAVGELCLWAFHVGQVGLMRDELNEEVARLKANLIEEDVGLTLEVCLTVSPACSLSGLNEFEASVDDFLG